MLRHNLILIYRNFKRFKTTFFINLIGLSTGLACTLLIYLWVKDESHEMLERRIIATVPKDLTSCIVYFFAFPCVIASSR